MRRAIFLGMTLTLSALAFACSGGGARSQPTTGITPAPGVLSGLSSQPAPDEGTFVIDLSADRWIQVLPTLGEYLVDVSPDGEAILYRVYPTPNAPELFAVDVDGSNRRKIGDGFVGAAFSPGGEKLAVWGQGRPLTLMDWPDGELVDTEVPTGVRTVLWSRQNDLAAETDDPSAARSELYLVRRDGTTERAARSSSLGALSWAPDGSRLAFVDANAVRTVEPGGQAEALATLSAYPYNANGPLSWSPDGGLLAVRAGRQATADPLYGTSDIVVIGATTGETRFTLISAGAAAGAWSPTRPVLLFDGNACLGGDWQLMLVDGDGTNLRPLASQHAFSYLAGTDWSPDGRFVVKMPAENGVVTTVDIATGETRGIFLGTGLLSGLRWVTRDRLVVSTTGGGDACAQDLGEKTRVVFP